MKETMRPWIGKATGSSDQGLIYSEYDGRNVAVVYDVRDMGLIAAAPELLEVCKRLIKYAPTFWGEDPQHWPKLMDRVETAVAKAEGNT